MPWDLTNELSAQRDAAANTFFDSGIIARLAETSDGQGGMVQAWAAVGTADCRLVANTGDSKQVGAQFNRVGDFTITFPYDEDVQENDRVTIDATVYRVLFVDDVRDWKTAVRVQANEEITE